MKTIGERIRQAREARNLSQADLAALVGFAHQSAIGNLESRATGRGGFKLAQIATALNVPLEWLMNGPDTASVPLIDGLVSSTRGGSSNLPMTDLDRAIAVLRRLPVKAQKEAMQFIDYLAVKHNTPSIDGAGDPLPAPSPRAA